MGGSPVERLEIRASNPNNISLHILREDKIDGFVSGNKYRKLKYNIEYALRKDFKGLLSFGGAYSNHVLAVSLVAKKHGLSSIGVIRGDELGKDITHTLANNSVLRQANENGMAFVFVARNHYRNICKNTNTPPLLERWKRTHFFIPEGGTNELAVKGCEEIIPDPHGFDFVCVPVGTGGTLAGIANSSNETTEVVGFPVLKHPNILEEITPFLKPKVKTPRMIDDYHFGGYAKLPEKLSVWIEEFERETHIKLDPIYTGKMIFGVEDLIKRGRFPQNAKVLCIHTGFVR